MEAAPPRRRQPQWDKLAPIAWAPVVSWQVAWLEFWSICYCACPCPYLSMDWLAPTWPALRIPGRAANPPSLPLCWQMYCMRFALKGRVQPATQHKIFIGMTLLALGHAGVVMSRDSSM